MARGAPDYDIYQRPAIAEQAFWEDTFEAPVLRWAPTSSAGSPDPILSQVQQWKGVQSVYFATVAVADEFSAITRGFPLVRPGKVGVEFFIYLNCRAPGYFQLNLRIFDGTNRADADLRLDSRARTASIVTPLGTFVIATLCFPGFPTRVWIPAKLIVDTVTDLYTRLFIGPQSIDLSTYALVPVAPTNDSMIGVYMALNGGVIGAMDAYLDNFILSQNEP